MEISLPSWERHSSRLYEYSRREPEKSALYQLLYNYREEFELRYEVLFDESAMGFCVILFLNLLMPILIAVSLDTAVPELYARLVITLS